MLVTTHDEIMAYLPTNLMSDPNMLLTLTEDAEQDYLLPMLGSELMNRLELAYEQVIGEGKSVVVGKIAPSEVTPEIELIRLCQKPILFCALANNVGILSVNLNSGGGFNVMDNDDFEAADDKRLDRFEKTAWRNAFRGMDRVLLYLENDAKKENPVFAEMWRKSNAFYLHNDLLFTTADCMNRYYNINGSREKYIELIPTIRYCQETFIASQVGHELLEALIDSETNLKVIPMEPPTSPKIWSRVKDMLRMALGTFVANRIQQKKKMDEGDAMVSLANAREYIRLNKACFGELYKTTPMYDPAIDEPAEGDSESADSFDERLRKVFNPDDPDNAIHAPFGWGINRH